MALRWAQAAYADLRRIHEFLEPVNAVAAARVVRAVASRVRRIPAQPRLGEKLTGFGNAYLGRYLVHRHDFKPLLCQQAVHRLNDGVFAGREHALFERGFDDEVGGHGAMLSDIFTIYSISIFCD